MKIYYLHPFVIWTATAFGRDPVYDLIWIRDIAGLAVYAIRKVNLQFLSTVPLFHLVNRCRAETLARVSILFGAASCTDLRIEHMKM